MPTKMVILKKSSNQVYSPTPPFFLNYFENNDFYF